MGKSAVKFFGVTPLLIILHFVLISHPALASDGRLGIGLKMGVSKLEGDWKEARLNPAGAFSIRFRPLPYFSIGGNVYLSWLKTSGDAPRINPAFTESSKFQTLVLPVEMEFRFNLAPFSRVNPFGYFGGGIFYWDAKYDGSTLWLNGEHQRKSGSHVMAGGGFEVRLSPTLCWSLGSDFRYSLTDYLDQIKSGDENDGVFSVWSGLTWYPLTHSDEDRDNDHIPKDLDLDPETPEDANGYMDHDGKPEGRIPEVAAARAPIVLHRPIFRAEAHKDLVIRARILSPAPLRTPAVLYRRPGEKNWKVKELEKANDDVYTATIEGDLITQRGLEYCVVAVDQRVKGVGYSGLPTKPIRVQVVPNGTKWRIAGGVISAVVCGAASFIILRKQSN